MPSFNFLFLFAGTGGTGGCNDDEEVVVFAAVDEDDDDSSLSSLVSFSIMKFHTNGSSIHRKDCVFSASPFKRGGVVINHPSQPICSSILFGESSLLFPILTT